MVRRLGGLALLLVVASALPSAAETYTLNLTGGNATWNGTSDWESLVSASLSVSSPGGSYPEIRDGNGSLLWAWAGRNVTVSASWSTGDPYVGALGENGMWAAQYTRLPVDLGNSSCAGNATLSLVFSSGFAEAWTTVPFVLAAVAGNNSTGAPFWTSTIGPLNTNPWPVSLSVPLPANVSRVWLRDINDTPAGGALYSGDLKLASASAVAPAVPGCAAENVSVGATPLPLRFNGSGNWSARGSATTDAWNVSANASSGGFNVSGAAFAFAGAGKSFSVVSPGVARVKAGTYAVSAIFNGLSCGPFYFSVDRDNWVECALPVPAPARPAQPAAAAGGGGGGGGGSEPAPEAPAPPPKAPETAQIAAKAPSGGSSSIRGQSVAAEAVATAMIRVVVSLGDPARLNDAFHALGEAMTWWGAPS